MSIIIKNSLTNTEYVLKKTITPDRFLWHVSKPKYTNQQQDHIPHRRNDILKNGLKFCHTNSVFAHNSIRLITEMYPIWMNSMEFNLSFSDMDRMIEEHKRLHWLKHYDFWRIDTDIYKGDWYIDPIIPGDLKFNPNLKSTPHNYICTPNEIPTAALTLFKFDPYLIQEYFSDLNPDIYHDIIHWKCLCPVSSSGSDPVQ